MKNIPFMLVTLGLSNCLIAAQPSRDNCASEPPATCYPGDCTTCYCLGPENYAVNAPVRPKTCDGDFVLSIAGFYWNTTQDGMEYAVDDRVRSPLRDDNFPASLVLNNLIEAKFVSPDFDWEFGFKLGAGYNSPCDGWDVSALWTSYSGKASRHDEAEQDDNHSLIALWSAFAPGNGGIVFATDIESHWKLDLNLIDVELGREFWVSKYVTVRPFVGVRIAFINQKFDLEHKGGAFSASETTIGQPNLNDYVTIRNNYNGTGLRAGLDSVWNLGCGWGIYGNLAADVVYGSFSIDYDEYYRNALSPHDKTYILQLDDDFNAARAMLDLGLGIQWQTLFCDCKYGFSIALGWEQHIFFDQNQMWRVVRTGDSGPESTTPNFPNDSGENTYYQRRGDLTTQGVTLEVQFAF